MRTSIGTYTKTAAYTPAAGVDVSALPTDYVVSLSVTELRATAGGGPKSAIIQLQHTTGADWSNPLPGPTFSFKTDLPAGSDGITESVTHAVFPNLPVGVAGGKLRAVLAQLDTNASITLDMELLT